MRVVEFESTPNPHAIKCWLDRQASGGPESFRSPAEGAGHPVAGPLFAAGATSVLLLGDWLTVNKPAQVSWPTMKARIRKALEPVEGVGGAS